MTDPEPESLAQVATARPRELGHDVRTAFGNTLKLGTSLIATWSVALLVRLFLPRHLGPERFGLYSFADSLAAAVLGFLSFGVDPYIQKEIPVRPAHASDFFGGVVVLRTLLAGLAAVAITVILQLSGRTTEAMLVVAVFALGYTVFNVNNSLAALLQANTTVGGLALANPIAKLAWGAAVGAGLAFRAPLSVLAAAFTFSETVRTLLLFHLVRRQLGLRLRIDLRATWSVIVQSLPYYLNALVLALNMRLDVTILGFVVRDDATVGWYGAAANLAGLSLILAPLMFSVLMPLLSRSYQRSPEEFWRVMRRALEALLAASLPVTLFLALGAETWVGVIFGRAFSPSAASLAGLAPQFVFTYVAMLLSMGLIVLGQGWRLARISLAGLLVHPVLSVALIVLGRRWLGPAGAGLGAALGAVSSEVAVTALLLVGLGPAAFDRRSVRTLARSLLVCAVVCGLYVALEPLGRLRLGLCGATYLALALALGVVRLPELWALRRVVRQARA